MDKNLLQFLNYKEPTKFNADDFFAKTSLAQELRKEAYNTSALVAQEAASGIGKAMSAIKPPLAQPDKVTPGAGASKSTTTSIPSSPKPSTGANKPTAGK